MPRPKGSVNKWIHFSSIDKLDIQSIYDEKKLYTSGFEPHHWFYRLQRISGNMPYIISMKQDMGKEKFVYSHYIDTDINVLDEKSNLVHLTKPGRRLNDCLDDELDDFMVAIFKWCLDQYEKKTDSCHLTILKIYDELLRISRNSLKNVSVGKVNKLLLLHNKAASILNIVKPDVTINSTADIGIRETWCEGWIEFWNAMIHKLEVQKLFFAQPSFKLKTGIAKNNKRFHKWIESGVVDFLEPQNDKLTDVDQVIRYLKMVVLNNKGKK